MKLLDKFKRWLDTPIGKVVELSDGTWLSLVKRTRFAKWHGMGRGGTWNMPATIKEYCIHNTDWQAQNFIDHYINIHTPAPINPIEEEIKKHLK